MTTLKEKLEEVEAAKELLGDAYEVTRQRVIDSFVGTTVVDRVSEEIIPEEAEDGPDSLMVITPERLKIFTDYMESHRVGLVRSPPYSGKTTLGRRLQEHFRTQGINTVYINLAAFAKELEEEAYTYARFNAYWVSKTNNSWESLTQYTTPIKIIVDEAQVIYNTAASFWGSLKFILSDLRSQNFRILLLSTYHPTYNIVTPMTFPDALGLSSLRLTQHEVEQLVSNYVHKRQSGTIGRSFSIPKLVEKTIFNFTHGYAGLCRTALSDLRHKFPNGGSPNDMLKHLASTRFLNRLMTSRALYWVHEWVPTESEADLLRRLLLKCDPDSTFQTLNIASFPQLEKYLKIGIIIEDYDIGKMYFAAPVLRIVLSNRLFTAPVNMQKSPTKTFDEFLVRTIERMCPSVLRDSFGRGVDDCLLERTWQMEWYRTARTAAPEESIISPDVGYIFGSDGFLDFYVDGDYGWGIELMREGKRLGNHAKRFEQGGHYEVIPMNDWAILDFRHHSKRVRNLMPNFWYILYSDDYNQVTIVRHDNEDRVLRLIGDSLDFVCS